MFCNMFLEKKICRKISNSPQPSKAWYNCKTENRFNCNSARSGIVIINCLLLNGVRDAQPKKRRTQHRISYSRTFDL